MPMHDWSRVPAGLFHHFHQEWSIEIARRLNRGGLPPELTALVEQRAGRTEPDVLAIEENAADPGTPLSGKSIVVLEQPKTQIVFRSSREAYADKANRVVIRHHLGRIVSVIELVSPGNKDSRLALREFVDKTIDFLRKGVHVLIVDLFPPSRRDPAGLHKVIWDEVEEQAFELPPGRDRVLASYEAGDTWNAYIEPIAVGEHLAEMPLFIASGRHVRVPLESTYVAAWEAAPAALRRAVETGHIEQ